MRKTVTLKTTLGAIKIKMEPDWAPNHVRNFLKLVSTGWYNGTAFHRLVKGFVVQGGMGDTRAGGATHPADRWVHPLKGEFRDGHQTRARHRFHGARRRSRFGHYQLLPLLGAAPAPRRPSTPHSAASSRAWRFWTPSKRKTWTARSPSAGWN